MKEEDFRKTFVKNLKYWTEKKDKKRADIVNDLDFPYSTVCDWFSGKNYPKIEVIQKLADYFGIKKSDLIEERKHNSNNKIIDLMIEELEKLKNRDDIEISSEVDFLKVAKLLDGTTYYKKYWEIRVIDNNLITRKEIEICKE